MTSIEASLGWLLGLVSGSLVTLVLTIAVALIGFLMLFGQVPLRRAAFVVLGGFILIGSGQIAQSLVSAVPQSRGEAPLPARNVPTEPARILGDPPPPPPARRGNPFDPYAANEGVN